MSTTPVTSLTMLSSMAGPDFPRAFDVHVEWGLDVLDLKDGLFGKLVERLTDAEAGQVVDAARARRLPVYTMSTCIFADDIEMGEGEFRERHCGTVERAAAIARILQPRQVRLIIATSARRAEFTNCADYLASRHPWVIATYAEAVDRLHEAGFHVTLESEPGNSLFARPQEIIDFFAALNRPGRASFTWDIQNLWETGTFPTLDVYRQLKPVIGMLHVKGGRAEQPGGPMKWASSLEDASWPVAAIVQAAVRDARSPVICLNPSHGERPPDGYAWTADDFRRDIEFLKKIQQG